MKYLTTILLATLSATTLAVPHEFKSGEVATAKKFNENFSDHESRLQTLENTADIPSPDNLITYLPSKVAVGEVRYTTQASTITSDPDLTSCLHTIEATGGEIDLEIDSGFQVQNTEIVLNGGYEKLIITSTNSYHDADAINPILELCGYSGLFSNPPLHNIEIFDVGEENSKLLQKLDINGFDVRLYSQQVVHSGDVVQAGYQYFIVLAHDGFFFRIPFFNENSQYDGVYHYYTPSNDLNLVDEMIDYVKIEKVNQ